MHKEVQQRVEHVRTPSTRGRKPGRGGDGRRSNGRSSDTPKSLTKAGMSRAGLANRLQQDTPSSAQNRHQSKPLGLTPLHSVGHFLTSIPSLHFVGLPLIHWREALYICSPISLHPCHLQSCACRRLGGVIDSVRNAFQGKSRLPRHPSKPYCLSIVRSRNSPKTDTTEYRLPLVDVWPGNNFSLYMGASLT